MKNALVSLVAGAVIAVLILLTVRAAADPQPVGLSMIAQADLPLDAGAAPAVAAPADAGSGSATPAPLPDPVADPIAAGSEVYKLYKSGGLIPSIIVGLFFLVTFLRAKIKWLQQGYRAVIVMGVLGALTILVEPATRSTTPTLGMVLGAIGAGIALALKWKPAPTSEANA